MKDLQPQIHTDFEQGTEDWYNIRAGRIGGTSCATLQVGGRSETGLGTGAITVLYKKASEFVEGVDMEDDIGNKWTDRGQELEPVARRDYEDRTFTSVAQVGYISLGEYLGVSPDGLIGKPGGLEIKCLSGPEHLRVLDNGYDKKHYIQCQWGLYISRRQWWDLYYFHPMYASKTYRLEPDEKMFGLWDEKVPVYIAELKRILELAQGTQAA